MLICNGFDEREFYEKTEKQLLIEMRKFKNMARIAIVVLALGIIVIINAFIISSSARERTENMMAAVIFIAVALFIAILAFAVRHKQIDNLAQKRLKDGGVKVYVEPDLSIVIKANDEQEVRIIQVKDFYHMKHTHTLHINGKMQGESQQSSHYIISLALNNRTLLEKYLILNKNQKDYQMFHNDTLKKVMHMKDERRNTLFLDLLKESQFLLACSLDKTGNTIHFLTNVTLSVASLKNKILVFTSMAEIDEELRKQYPILFICSLSDIISHYTITQSHIFNTSTPHGMEGVIINKNEEQLALELIPLKELLEA